MKRSILIGSVFLAWLMLPKAGLAGDDEDAYQEEGLSVPSIGPSYAGMLVLCNTCSAGWTQPSSLPKMMEADTPLHLALQEVDGQANESNLLIAQCLVAYGADANLSNNQGTSPWC